METVSVIDASLSGVLFGLHSTRAAVALSQPSALISRAVGRDACLTGLVTIVIYYPLASAFHNSNNDILHLRLN